MSFAEITRAPWAVGVDIGGTKTAVAAVDKLGAIQARVLLATEAESGFARAVERLADAIRRVGVEAGLALEGLAGIGIGCAGPVDPGGGLINNPYTLAGWDRCDIVTPLRERFGVPVYLENDADAALLGECLAGAGRGCDPVVMLTFGTGVGGATVLRGLIHRGTRGEHPELGHLPVLADGPPCYCGIRGCLESLASGTALAEAGKPAGYPDARAVLTAAARGEPPAQAIVERALHAAATAAWTIAHTLLPARLILGGGMMDQHFDLFAEAMRQRLTLATQFTPAGLSVARAQLGNEAGTVGAAARVWQTQGTG